MILGLLAVTSPGDAPVGLSLGFAPKVGAF
jgi:hypothetical protein